MISELCIFDLSNGEVELILSTDNHIEAPNWHPDGQKLIINSEGKIYAVPLDTCDMHIIDTGFATNCNNDHGISPDGSQLVISDKTETGKSTIYVLPFKGGTHTRVTSQTPSYWHGWSPDGETLAYVGNRGSGFQVFTIPVGGGTEFQVTKDFDHCDGPDYSADGNWIWFNGEKKGQVNLWRVRPDGRDLTQMSDDEMVNWFPHPSPDGRHILYLAYPQGTFGHPANMDVELRLMPANGGASKLLVKLFGGQGSINVPCWSPDSRKFAFVRYRQ